MRDDFLMICDSYKNQEVALLIIAFIMLPPG